MKWVNKGHEFDEIAKIICDRENTYYIWGAGVFGISFYEIFKDKIEIRGFIDSNKDKQNETIDGKKIYSPQYLQTLKQKDDSKVKIIVGNGWIKEVYAELNKMQYVINEDYFHVNDFMAIYMLYQENKIYAVSANIAITTKCTLKCEKCMALMPYVKNPQNLSLEKICKELETYFKWVDYLGILGLGGGDVLVHPDFPEILEYVCEQYLGKKVNAVEIYTNAIIMPSDKILDICRRYNVIVRFSDYSKGIPGRQKIDELITVLNNNDIRYDRAVWETWYDIGFPQESNGIIGVEELCKHYDKCITKLCAIILDERLYFCSVHASAVQAGYCNPEEADSFDLLNYSESRKKEFIEFNSGYCNNGYLGYCHRCNGYQNINDKFVPVAKQIEKVIK